MSRQALALPEGQAKRAQACRLAETDMLDICLERPRSRPMGGGFQAGARPAPVGAGPSENCLVTNG